MNCVLFTNYGVTGMEQFFYGVLIFCRSRNGESLKKLKCMQDSMVSEETNKYFSVNFLHLRVLIEWYCYYFL